MITLLPMSCWLVLKYGPHALLHYRFHERNKMKIIMAFDLDDHPEVGTQTPDGIPIYGISQIKDKIKDADVKTAILTVPSVKSQEVANLLVDAGVKGNSQFSPVHLHLPKTWSFNMSI